MVVSIVNYVTFCGRHKNKWIPATKLTSKRGNAAINYIPSMDVVWITGGRSSRKGFLSSTEILTKSDGQWKIEAGTELETKLAGHCTVMRSINEHQDEVIIIGGGTVNSAGTIIWLNAVKSYLFDDKFGQSGTKILPSLNVQRSGHACTLSAARGEETIFVAGGQRASKDTITSVETLCLESSSCKWRTRASLPTALSGASFVTKLGIPTLIGGTGYKENGEDPSSRSLKELIFSNQVYSYDIKNDRWEKSGEIEETVAYHTTAVLENDLCIAIQNEKNPDADYEYEY